MSIFDNFFSSGKNRADKQNLYTSKQINEALRPLERKEGIPLSVSPAAISHMISRQKDMPESAAGNEPAAPIKKSRMARSIISIAAAAAVLITGAIVYQSMPSILDGGNLVSRMMLDTKVPAAVHYSVNPELSPGDYSQVYDKLISIGMDKAQEGPGWFERVFGGWGFNGAQKSTDNAEGGILEDDAFDYELNKGDVPQAAQSQAASEATNSSQNGTSDEDKETDKKRPATSDDDYGKTNEQVEGVNEADIIKNDGKHLYYLHNNGYGMTYIAIISAGADGKMKELSRTQVLVNGSQIQSQDMYIYNDYLVVIGAVAPSYEGGSVSSRDPMDYSESTVAVIYDISDRGNVKKLRTYMQQGRAVSTRMIGRHIYLVSDYTCIPEKPLTKDNIDQYLPRITGFDGNMNLVPAGDIAIMPEVKMPRYVVASAIDITAEEKVSKLAILGGGEQVYAAIDNLFVAAGGIGGSGYEPVTDIMRFSIEDFKITMCASGRVNGYIINQFAMDYYKNCFRIATTTSGSELYNNVYVLDSGLKQIGAVTGLAKGETIKSVRFNGDIGYVVTFRQTDPLFAIDFTNPAKPVVRSELKITGFSTYMHPVDDTTMFGIGVGGDEWGGTFGTKITLFDVSDPDNVYDIKNMVLGSYGSYSQAINDHKAVTYIEKSKLLVIPATIEIPGDNGYADVFKGFTVIKMDRNDMRVLAYITPAMRNSDVKGQYVLDALSVDSAARSTYIAGALYLIQGNTIMSVSMSDFTLIDKIVYEAPGSVDSRYYEKMAFMTVFNTKRNVIAAGTKSFGTKLADQYGSFNPNAGYDEFNDADVSKPSGGWIELE